MTQHIKYSEHVISDNVKAYRDDSFASFLDNFKINILDEYYDKENSLFKKRIDFLNMRFYIETEKCLDSKIDIQLCKDKLLLILFKQIFLYMEEIERLHKLIKEKDKTITSKKDKISFQHKYKDLKEKLKLCECKFKTLNDSYLKMKNDYDDLKMQNEIYCEQIKSIIEDNNGKDIRDLNKFKEYPNINLMPISVAKESNFEIHSIKETNENRLDNDKTSCFSHFLHNNMNTSDKNCKHTGNDHTNYTSFKKESIEVNNININLNLNWKDNNHKNINAKINYNKKSENTKGEIAKAYKTVSNSTKMSNIEKNTPMKIKQDKPEVNTKIKTKNKNNIPVAKDIRNRLNSEITIGANNLNKNNDVLNKKIRKINVSKENASSIITPNLISNDYEESKLNVSATDNKCIDISAIKNIVLSNFKKYEDELIALNELEKLIVHITEKTNNENIKEFEMSYKNLFINHSFTEGEFNHSKDKLLADISLSSDNKFIKKKYRSSCYNLLHKK